MSDVLTVRLGEKLQRALEEAAHQSGLAKGEVVRQALEAHLHSQGRLKVMERYFGVINGPADLSTNKAYRREWHRRRK